MLPQTAFELWTSEGGCPSSTASGSKSPRRRVWEWVWKGSLEKRLERAVASEPDPANASDPLTVAELYRKAQYPLYLKAQEVGWQTQELDWQTQELNQRAQRPGQQAQELRLQAQELVAEAQELVAQAEQLGRRAQALGERAQALGERAQALGEQAQALGEQALGEQAQALGQQAQALGQQAQALGQQAQEPYRWWRVTLNQRSVRRLRNLAGYPESRPEELTAEATSFLGLARQSNWMVLNQLTAAFNHAAALFGIQLGLWIAAAVAFYVHVHGW